MGRLALGCVCLALAGCMVPEARPETVTHTRADGEVVSCNRPAPALMTTEQAQGLSAAFPDIIQELGASGNEQDKIGDLLARAPTPDLLDVLDYRVCLAYGEGELTKEAWTAWQETIQPALDRRVRRPPG